MNPEAADIPDAPPTTIESACSIFSFNKLMSSCNTIFDKFNYSITKVCETSLIHPTK